MEFGRWCKLMVDVGADTSTAGVQRSLVERCSEVARSCQSVPLQVAVHTNCSSRRCGHASAAPPPEMILGCAVDSYHVRPTLYS